MKRPKEAALPLPSHDYGLALQNAVSWLGDRHLLAQPVPRRSVEGDRAAQPQALIKKTPVGCAPDAASPVAAADQSR
jgi:hypothetical protein